MKNKLHNLLQRSLVLVFLTLLAIAPGMKGWGQAILYEDFNYTPPAYIGGNGAAGSSSNNWTTHSVTTGETTTIDIVNGNLSYPGLFPPNGYKVYFFSNANATSRDVNRALTPAGSPTVMYYSALINIIDNSQISATSFDYFLSFGGTSGNSVTSLFGRLHIKSVNTGANFRLGIQNVSGTGATQTEYLTDLNFNTTYLIVVKYDFNGTGNDIASLWVNPTSLGGIEPSGAVTNSSSATQPLAFASICLRNNAVSPKAYIDEIRVGPTWADVTPTGSPLITVTPNTLTGFTYVQGSGPSPEQSFSISGANLTNDIFIVPPTNYEISTGTGGLFLATSPVILTQTGGTVGATNIFVRLKAGLTAGTYNGEIITATSSGATNATVTCDGSVTSAPLPLISINPTTLTGFIAISGTASSSQNYTVSGDNLVSDVTVTAPANYEVSTDNISFTSTVILPQAGGNISGEPKMVYVRIAATAPGGAANGDVAHTSTNATPVNLAVTGTVYFPEPTNHASGFVATATGFSSINLAWSDNDGTQPATGFLILANTTGLFTDPGDGAPQTDDFNLADGSGVRNIAHGIHTCNWTGLNPLTPYYFAIYAYTNSGTNINYKTTPSAPTANVTTMAYVEPLAAWTFDTTQTAPNTPGSLAANAGTQLTATFYADSTNGSSMWHSTATSPELTTFGGTTLNDPRIAALSGNAIVLADTSANGKSVVFKYSMTGYKDPVLTFATRGTTTGFGTHQWAWSTDNVNYTDFGTNTVNTTTTFLLRTLDMSTIDALDQAAIVYLRLTVSGATSASGNNRLDNVVLRATAESASKSLTVKAYLEGLYTGTGLMSPAMDGNTGLPKFGADIADQVIIQLRTDGNYSNIEYSSGPVNLSTSGVVTVNDIPSDLSGSYYITIKHRNSIETTSANAVSFAGSTVSYDFTTSASQAFGDNMRLMGSEYAIWGGDVNQDGVVDTGDMNSVENESTAFTMGYIPEDANGDGIVDTSDMNIIENNSTAFILVITP